MFDKGKEYDKMTYCIQDAETGFFLNCRSFQPKNKDKKEWVYTVYTGRLGTSFFSNEWSAKNLLSTLNTYLERLNVNTKLHIVKVNSNDLPEGKRIVLEI